MTDFTSANILGLRHASNDLRPWPRLSLGKPAALAEPTSAVSVARALAQLQGCEAAALAPSTLHLFFDIVGLLARGRVAFYLDAGVYPIAKWSAERVTTRVPVRTFRHHDPQALRAALARDRASKRRPIIVADGFCPHCGSPAPLRDYIAAASQYGGTLLIDDTQALGVLGAGPTRENPYGGGGGGSFRWWGLRSSNVLVVCSLAKALGAPVAALSGSAAAVRWFKDASETRVHCSPPSVPVIEAARRALEVNAAMGDRLRQRVRALVSRFRRGALAAGWDVAGGPFPVQTITSLSPDRAAALHSRLLGLGVRTALLGSRTDRTCRVCFIISAAHVPQDIDRAVSALSERHRRAAA